MPGLRRSIRAAVALSCAALAAPGGVARAAPGDLDRSFARDGILTTRFGVGQAVAIQRDGRIVAAGSAVSARRARFALARYLPDGRPDRSFGGDGRVTTSFTERRFVTVDALAIQRDGRIVAAGRAGGVGGRFALARFRPDGRLDRSFSRDGRQTTSFGARCRFSEARSLAIQRDGRIVAAGHAGCGSVAAASFALARYRRDGRLDPSFAGDGRLTTDFTAAFDAAYDVLVQRDGRIVAIGTAGVDMDDARFALARYTPSGRLDRSFGGDGRVTNLFTGEKRCAPAEAYAGALQRDGRIVAAGLTGCGHPYFALARYHRNGALDRSFGGDGKVATIFNEGDCSDHASDVVVQRDSKIVAAGVAGCRDPHPEFALARYGPTGALDPAFGRDGTVRTRTRADRSCLEQVNALALQRDGRIVAAGPSGCNRVALVRYLAR